jgi:hypothetical protein
MVSDEETLTNLVKNLLWFDFLKTYLPQRIISN